MGLVDAIWMAFLSDWLDGKLARRWGTVTANLRQADSIADTFYTIGVVLSLWFSHPAIIASHAWGIAMIVFLEAARYPLDWYRFGRGASYHAYSAKLFGISIMAAVITWQGEKICEYIKAFYMLCYMRVGEKKS